MKQKTLRRFDADCYAGRWPFHSCRFGAMDALRKMHEQAGIQGGMVSSVQSVFYQDPLSAEQELHHALPPRYGQVFSINPLLPGAVDMVQEAVETYGIKGLRLTRGYHRFDWPADGVRALLEKAQESGLAVYVTLRLEDARLDYIVQPVQEDAMQLAAAMEDWPDIPVILSSIYPAEVEQMRSTVLRRRHTCVDTACFKGAADCLERAVDSIGSERILFGSGATLGVVQSGVELLEHSRLSDRDRENIWWNNAARIFGLQPEA